MCSIMCCIYLHIKNTLFWMCGDVCPELIEETTLYRELKFGI